MTKVTTQFYSVSCGQHTSSTTSAEGALGWITEHAQPHMACSITRITVSDERMTEEPLLEYAGHKRKAKLKKRHHKRGLRPRNKKRRMQKYGGKAP